MQIDTGNGGGGLLRASLRIWLRDGPVNCKSILEVASGGLPKASSQYLARGGPATRSGLPRLMQASSQGLVQGGPADVQINTGSGPGGLLEASSQDLAQGYRDFRSVNVSAALLTESSKADSQYA